MPQPDPPHRPERFSSCAMVARLSAYSDPKRTTRNTRSCPAGTPSFRERYASRVILFSRFLLTDPPLPRATTTANLVAVLWLFLKRSFNPRDSTLRAVVNSSRMSLLLRSRSRLVRLLLIRGRELDSSFCAPALQNEPPALGGHPRTETELSCPFGLAGLIGPFHERMLLANPDEQVFFLRVGWQKRI